MHHLKVFNFFFQLHAVLIALLLIPTYSSAQFSVDEPSGDENYYNENFLRFENHTYQRNVKTVMLHPKDWPIAAPFIVLNDPNSILELHFDVLDSTLGNYMY